MSVEHSEKRKKDKIAKGEVIFEAAGNSQQAQKPKAESWKEYKKHREAVQPDYQQKVGNGSERKKPERSTAFAQSITKGSEMLNIELPPKCIIIDDWFKEGDLGFIFAYRGAGKTWLALDLCIALAAGAKCGPWQVNGEWSTLYIDGEMSYADDKGRILGLHRSIPENLHLLNHEVLFHSFGLVMNFGNASDQNIITQICLDKAIKVLVLDNLGCLVSGVAENEADEWEKILPWLLGLRRHGISIIIVHHSGHDSTRMRGTVKREDSAAWVLRLDDQRQDYTEAGARFISRFRKLRGQKSVPDYEWHYEPAGEANVEVTFKEASRADTVLQWVRDGLTTCGKIAQELGVSEGTISKLATQLIKQGQLKKNGRDYAIPP
jgi:DNA-binding CsgD family transcriptional regulator